MQTFNRCLVRDSGAVRCLKLAGHQGECQFTDGQRALDEAERRTTLTIYTDGDLKSLGIALVTDPDDPAVTQCAIVLMQDAAGRLLMVKPDDAVSRSAGILEIANDLRMRGAVVRFGVGSVTIMTPEAAARHE